MCYHWGKTPWGERIDPGPAKQLTMCFPYLSTTIRINGATHVLKLKHLPWSRQSDFFHKRAWGRVTISFKEKKKALDECEPCFCRPLCLYSTHTALSGSLCISEALHAHYVSADPDLMRCVKVFGLSKLKMWWVERHCVRPQLAFEGCRAITLV